MCDKLLNKKCKLSTNIPDGGIIIWSGSILNIPKGWLLCDGTLGTPDLKDKFVMGTGTLPIGSIGGTKQIILTQDNLPPHAHAYHDTKIVMQPIEVGTVNPVHYDFSFPADNRKLTQDGPGTSAPIDNLPPYYVIAFIQKRACKCKCKK